MNKGQNKPADVERHADAWLKGHEVLVNDWLNQGARRRHVMRVRRPFCAKKNARQLPGVFWAQHLAGPRGSDAGAVALATFLMQATLALEAEEAGLLLAHAGPHSGGGCTSPTER